PAERAGRRGDHHNLRDILFDDRPDNRRGDRGVLESLFGEIEVGARPNQQGDRVGIIQRGGFVLLSGNHARLEHFVRTALLRVGDVYLRLGGLHVRVGLIVLILDVARIYLRDQIARLHRGASLHGHPRDQTGGLGLDLDDVDRLNDAVRLRVDDDVAPADRGRRDGRTLDLVATAR